MSYFWLIMTNCYQFCHIFDTLWLKMIPKVAEENEYSPRACRRARNFFQVCLLHWNCEIKVLVLNTIRDTNSVEKIWKTCLCFRAWKKCICICYVTLKRWNITIYFFLQYFMSLGRPSCMIFAMMRSDKSRGGKLLFHQK